ncbi:DJ-1/PfpI family protein [Henriciella litoralis]|uniref:DJ-1/PfpI family protein n=1 Tax=Henriciella litoralis TaxID=568102 RepID=UPI00146B0AB4|nr:DJ-1/PfpI family protein [Henriciella litoralis]
MSKNDISRRTFNALILAAGGSLAVGSAHADQAEPEKAEARPTRVTILLYPGTTVLDWIGPYEALHRVDGVEVVLAGKTTDLMKSDSGIVEYKANVPLSEIDYTDVLIVPGGAKEMMTAANDPEIADWIKAIDETSQYTVGICTGALFLAHVGLLEGRRATTYWKFTPMLAGGGAIYEDARWVRDGKYWTSAGVSAGIDLTLALIADLYDDETAMKAQLGIEYDPAPPFNAGSVSTAPQSVVDALGGAVENPVGAN